MGLLGTLGTPMMGYKLPPVSISPGLGVGLAGQLGISVGWIVGSVGLN